MYCINVIHRLHCINIIHRLHCIHGIECMHRAISRHWVHCMQCIQCVHCKYVQIRNKCIQIGADRLQAVSHRLHRAGDVLIELQMAADRRKQESAH